MSGILSYSHNQHINNHNHHHHNHRHHDHHHHNHHHHDHHLTSCMLLKVWDLRTIRNGSNPLAHFTYHRGPITSIEWAINDESVISMTSADDQLTIWDLSVEADDINHLSIQQHDPSLAEYPPQLLFIHQGQQNMKELHYHPQIPGVIASTAENGMNVFKPAITVSS